MSEPTKRAIGRFRLASFISAFIAVAIIHPSYAKAVQQMAANIPFPPVASLTAKPYSKFAPSVPLIIPISVPTSAINAIGISFITVVETCILPASFGAIAFIK